jgi:hypothetical protein
VWRAFCIISLAVSITAAVGFRGRLWFFFGKQLYTPAQVVCEGFTVNNNIGKFGDKLF